MRRCSGDRNRAARPVGREPMTTSVLTGLLLQGIAVGSVHVSIKGRWLHHLGAMFLAVAVIYHGGSEVLQAMWPGRSRYRTMVAQADVDAWMLLVSAAI